MSIVVVGSRGGARVGGAGRDGDGDGEGDGDGDGDGDDNNDSDGDNNGDGDGEDDNGYDGGEGDDTGGGRRADAAAAAYGATNPGGHARSSANAGCNAISANSSSFPQSSDVCATALPLGTLCSPSPRLSR